MLLKTLKSGSNKLLAPPLACSNVPVLCTVPSEGRRWHRWHPLQGCATLLVHTLKRPRKDETKRCRRTKNEVFILRFGFPSWNNDDGSGGPRGSGAPPPPQILADQLTLFRPGEQIMPTTLLLDPSYFQTLLRPWSWNDDDGGDLRVKSRYCTRI